MQYSDFGVPIRPIYEHKALNSSNNYKLSPQKNLSNCQNKRIVFYVPTQEIDSISLKPIYSHMISKSPQGIERSLYSVRQKLDCQRNGQSIQTEWSAFQRPFPSAVPIYVHYKRKKDGWCMRLSSLQSIDNQDDDQINWTKMHNSIAFYAFITFNPSAQN